jgi:aminomethyltransferase
MSLGAPHSFPVPSPTPQRPTDMKVTPLHAVHLELGARLVEFGGWHMPVQYGPILEEVRTVRERAGLFDLGHMGRVLVTGRDATAYLDKLTTNFCAQIPEGSIRYSLLCKPDGYPIDDLLVYREAQGYYLVVNASNTEHDLAWMCEHALGFKDVDLDHQTPTTTMIALQGPVAQRVLQPLVERDLAEIGYYRFGFATVLGVPDVRLSRTGYTGEDGFEIYFPNEHAEAMWRGILAAGQDAGVRPCGLGARDTLRLEAGMALYGHELDEQHHPLEAGLDFAVSFAQEKGDWIGREALLAARENRTRRLVGVRTDGKRVPRQGYALFAGGEPVGEVVSGSVSPTLGTNIGSAYVRLGHDRAGTELEMDVNGKRQTCVVQDLPFYSRTRKKKS